jgi:hypothetical protein|tara:strand:- start:498 stop:1325 length:828 start_codon:yes stop_codon:yes gene_type:complete
MRIAISGTGNQGKSTLINDFVQEWPNFKTESSTYRAKLVAEKLPHSKNATKDTQWKILNHMIDEMQTFGSEDNIIMDRCPIDNLIYSLWCFEKGVGDIDKEFIDKCIPLVCESMRNLDIIFFIPITKAAPVAIEEDGVRETDEVYIKEVDNIFKMIGAQHHENNGRNPFFPKDDAPGWIEVFGDRQTRVAMIKQYLDADGDLIGGTEESMNELINPHDGQSTDEARQQMNDLLKDQEKANQFATDLAEQKQQIKEMLGDDDVISLAAAYKGEIKQ